MNARELGKAMRESAWVPQGFKVKWQRNSPSGMQRGTDFASTLAEACAIAVTRMSHCGLPAAAEVIIVDGGKTFRTYIVSFDGKLTYSEQA